MKFMGMMLLLLLSSFVAVSADEEPAKPAAPVIPGSEILLFDIDVDSAGKISLGTGLNITNQPGYDSQPRFSNDGQIIYYTRAVNGPESTQMDIYQYDLSSAKTSPYMTTAASEYSPTPIRDEPGLAVVQVDDQGDQYITLLNAEADAENRIKRYADLKQVGYFGWTYGYKVWSFVLNEAGGGDLIHMGKGKKPFELMKNVGRTFVTDKEQRVVYFVDKNTTPWRIKSKQRKLHDAIDIMALPEGVEDFTYDYSGRFWAGQNNTLMVSTDQKTWQKVKTFELPGLGNISRVTTNPEANKIAIVFAEKNHNE